jgi:hypothetical protein
MTELLEKAIATVTRLDPARQDEIARIMLAVSGEEKEPEDIDPEDLPHVLEGLAQAERGEFASEEQIKATFARFDV